MPTVNSTVQVHCAVPASLSRFHDKDADRPPRITVLVRINVRAKVQEESADYATIFDYWVGSPVPNLPREA